MTNRERYNFDDFTLKEYEKLLVTAKKSHTFISFEEKFVDNFLICRHDIDVSVHRAFRMAEIEMNNNISSTYFVLLHSEFYNALDIVNLNLLKKIHDMGHWVGLHFDSSFYNINDSNDLAKWLNYEKLILETSLNCEVKSFAFHNPTTFDLEFDEHIYGGLVNAYSKKIKQLAKYCSDSNGYWRYDRMLDVVNSRDHKNLYLLTHPEWWSDEVTSPKERITRALNGRLDNTYQNYDRFLLSNKRENIDW
ncbi:MAG: hypothetical protein HOP11_07045 [Saprospiraceae bacterium]|nr:hypothetical protein [Saprospiraceae bacterium]